MLMVDYLQINPGSFVVFAGIIGLIIGSFLNVVIYRLPIMMDREALFACRELLGSCDISSSSESEPFNLVVPRSRCLRCGHLITAFENIPLISWLLLRARCSQCKGVISPRYPAIEMLTGVLSAFVAWYFGLSWQAGGALCFTWALIALTFIDFDHQLLPDSITLPLLWAGLLASIFGIFTDLEASIIGAMSGYLVLWSICNVYKLLTGKEGMGGGDFKLLAMIGAWLGWQDLPFTLFLASALGAAVGLSLIIFRHHDKSIPIPFGPYLAVAGWVALFWDSDFTRWYLS